MATNNIKIFDENKGNMMSTQEYSTNAQRLNGVQQGIASSMLQNKTLYQVSLIAYAIGQMMVNNGLDANDDNAVSAFVGNLANTIVQKVVDKASTVEAQAGTDANKFMTPATTLAAINILKATSQMATAGIDDAHWMTPALVKEAIEPVLNTANSKIGINFGSYKGNGEYGSSSPTIISFNEFPKLFILYSYNSSSYINLVYFIITRDDLTSEYKRIMYMRSGTARVDIYAKITNNSLYFYADNPEDQLNSSGLTYRYLTLS